MTGQSESETDIQSEVIDLKDIEGYQKKKKKSGQQFMCSYNDCNAVFKRLYRLKRHLNQHTGEVCLNYKFRLHLITVLYMNLAAICVSSERLFAFIHL